MSSESVWHDYQEALEYARKRVLDASFLKNHGLERAQGLYMVQMLQHKAFTFYIAPRRAYPVFYSQSVFMPFEIQWGLPSPDFIYRWAFIDGGHTYRVWGKRGTTAWLHGQLQRGWWGDDIRESHLGDCDFEKIKVEADGSFEILLSPQSQPGNWIRLDPEVRNITLNFREIYNDWEGEHGAEMYIECLDRRPDEQVLYGEEEFAARLKGAAKLIRFYADFADQFTSRILDKAGGTNKFWMQPQSREYGGNPHACYIAMVYDIQPDEAIIVETELPERAAYWSLQLGDLWFQTIDFTYSQSSLNGHQARLDADGKCRMVLSLRDPGVPNWIDASGLDYGIAQWRWYVADSLPVPNARLVKLSDVRRHLPADTPSVSPEQRTLQLRRRAQASLARYGFAPKG